MKLLKNKVLIICVAVALTVALITGIFAVLGFSGPIRLVLGTVAKPFELVGTFVSNAVNGFVEVFFDYEELRQENESLKAELESRDEESYNAGILKEENEWLREYLGFATEHPDFRLTDARVIARENDSYSTTLVLNKGSVHGVKKDMPVVTEKGTFGQVVEVGLDWCRVSSIVAPDAAVGAYVERSGAVGVVDGDTDLEGNGKCHMVYIDSTADIRIGDRIYTSGGVGSVYPSGLYIGEVSSFEADPDTRTLTVTIDPAVDFSSVEDITRLMIITGYNGGNG